MSAPATFRCEGCHAYCVVGLERLQADPEFVLDWARVHARCCEKRGAGGPRPPVEAEPSRCDVFGCRNAASADGVCKQHQPESPPPKPSPEGQGTPPLFDGRPIRVGPLQTLAVLRALLLCERAFGRGASLREFYAARCWLCGKRPRRVVRRSHHGGTSTRLADGESWRILTSLAERGYVERAPDATARIAERRGGVWRLSPLGRSLAERWDALQPVAFTETEGQE